ncbi:hypothetical protein [Henriciella litoralis]|uniref:hypothetical protein n=1 Tax=Henriciella litoralis TaxID=568102 RepID=UPI0009FE5E5F|nr:hypothetical protein [Henriciella litoralis]
MSDHKNSEPAGREDFAPYETRPRKKRIGLWIGLGIAGVVILLLGTCGWTFAGLWKDTLERQDATQVFIAQVYETGLPPAGDPIYHPQFAATQQQIDEVSTFADSFGAPIETGATSCTTTVSANSDALQSGKRSECATPMQFKGTGGQIAVIWKMDGDTWKVFHVGFNYENIAAANPASPAETEMRPEDSQGQASPD